MWQPTLLARSVATALLCSTMAAAPALAQKGGPTRTAWVTGAVGTVAVQGSATISKNGRISISGEGTDIASTADGFQFLYQRVSGDIQITARITGLQNTDPWAKAGVMIRQTLTAGSAHSSVLMTPSNGVLFEQRTTASGQTTGSGLSAVIPTWLRVTLVAGTFRGSVSADGSNWVDVGSGPLAMTGDIYVGLAVTSRRPSQLTTATFDKVTLAVPNVPPPSPPAGPIAAWSFDDGAGSAAKDSIGSLDGVITGATWTTAGRFGGALLFNGVDDLVTVSPNAALNLTTGMTLEAWVSPTLLTSWRSVAVKEGATDLAYGLYANNAGSGPQSAVNLGAGRLDATGTTTLPLGKWSHVAATFDGTTARLLVNGVEVGQAAASGTLLQTSGALRIGGNLMLGEWFNGAIDDVRLYNRALTASEIQTDMATPVDPPPPDTTPPSVTISSPLSGTTASGTVAVVASATDDTGVASVQFLLNASNLGSAVTSAPYTVTWNTAGTPNGTYKLTAVVRDLAGNANVSSDVTVTVNNGGGTSVLVNGRYVQFTSIDHLATLSNGTPKVSGYTLDVWMAGSDTSTGQPYRVSNLGKPASTATAITVDQQAFFSTLPKNQPFFTTITAIGPGGSTRSSPSNTFVMQ